MFQIRLFAFKTPRQREMFISFFKRLFQGNMSRYHTSVGLPPVASWGKQVENVDALADLVLAEPLCPLSPVPVDHDAAVRMLTGMLDIK